MKQPSQPTADRSLHWIIFGLVAILCGFVFMMSRIWLVCYGSTKVEAALKQIGADLPKTTEDSGEDSVEVILNIAANGTITIDEGDPVTDLSASLKQLVASSQGHKLIVTISAHEKTTYEQVLQVMNALSAADIKNVTFTVGIEEL